jgi:hypothetical protein
VALCPQAKTVPLFVVCQQQDKKRKRKTFRIPSWAKSFRNAYTVVERCCSPSSSTSLIAWSTGGFAVTTSTVQKEGCYSGNWAKSKIATTKVCTFNGEFFQCLKLRHWCSGRGESRWRSNCCSLCGLGSFGRDVLTCESWYEIDVATWATQFVQKKKNPVYQSLRFASCDKNAPLNSWLCVRSETYRGIFPGCSESSQNCFRTTEMQNHVSLRREHSFFFFLFFAL